MNLAVLPIQGRSFKDSWVFLFNIQILGQKYKDTYFSCICNYVNVFTKKLNKTEKLRA